MARNYSALPYDYLEEMSELNDAEFGRLTRALLVYSMTGEQIALCGNERFYAKRVMMQEDRFKASYDDISTTRSEAGRAGAAARWANKSDEENGKNGKNGKRIFANGKNSKANACDGKNGNTETNTDTNTLLSNDSKGIYAHAREAFHPPAYDEVCEYNRMRGGLIDPKPFFDYYDAAGWRDSEGKPVYNWQQKFIAWELRELNGRKGAKNGSEQHTDDDADKQWDIPGAIYLD